MVHSYVVVIHVICLLYNINIHDFKGQVQYSGSRLMNSGIYHFWDCPNVMAYKVDSLTRRVLNELSVVGVIWKK